MNIVTISTKYQVEIPKEIREKLELKPGKKLQIFSFDNRIELIIPKNIKNARGFLKGINTDINRECLSFKKKK
jgi:AbrB family looped-hinge helix DNA binding protein